MVPFSPFAVELETPRYCRDDNDVHASGRSPQNALPFSDSIVSIVSAESAAGSVPLSLHQSRFSSLSNDTPQQCRVPKQCRCLRPGNSPPPPPSPLRSSCTYTRLVKADHDSGMLSLKLLELSRRVLE